MPAVPNGAQAVKCNDLLWRFGFLPQPIEDSIVDNVLLQGEILNRGSDMAKGEQSDAIQLPLFSPDTIN